MNKKGRKAFFYSARSRLGAGPGAAEGVPLSTITLYTIGTFLSSKKNKKNFLKRC